MLCSEGDRRPWSDGDPRPEERELEEQTDMEYMPVVVLATAWDVMGEKVSWEVWFTMGDIPSIVDERRVG